MEGDMRHLWTLIPAEVKAAVEQPAGAVTAVKRPVRRKAK
jgi:hypothetical protein